MNSTEQQIISQLIDDQKALGDNDSDFARRLGVDRALWIHSRTGRRRLGPTLANAAAKAFPKYEPLVLIFLRYDFPVRKRIVKHSTPALAS